VAAIILKLRNGDMTRMVNRKSVDIPGMILHKDINTNIMLKIIDYSGNLICVKFLTST